MMDYWDECIKIAFEDAGITATAEQLFAWKCGVEGHLKYRMTSANNERNPMRAVARLFEMVKQ